MTEKKHWKVGDVYYIAEIYRHGHGVDYECEPHADEQSAEAELADCLGMMSPRERSQSARESFVGRYRVEALDDGEIGMATSY